MSTINIHGERNFARSRRADQRQYQMMLWAAYPLFLVLAVAARLSRHPSPMFPKGGSIFTQAHAAAATCIPFAFQ